MSTSKAEIVSDMENSGCEDEEDDSVDGIICSYDSSSKKSRNMADGVWLQEELVK